MFLKYLVKMDLILMLSKFSGQIGPKPKCFVFHSTFDRSGVLMESALCLRFLDIEDLTHKTGNFKQYKVFVNMLESALNKVR